MIDHHLSILFSATFNHTKQTQYIYKRFIFTLFLLFFLAVQSSGHLPFIFRVYKTNMAIFNYVVMAVALATASHAALPKVTPVLAGSDCSVYPGYDASMETAGPFIIQTNSCTNSSIEGFGDSQDLFYQEGVEGIYRGYVSFSFLFLFLFLFFLFQHK